MLKEHKNRLFNIIQDVGVDISYFEATERGSVFAISVRNAPIVFKLKQVPGRFDEFAITYTIYQPDFPLDISEEKFENIDTYYNINGGIDDKFKYWLNAVVKRHIYEKEMPDLWSQLQFYSPLITAFNEDDLKQFSSEQKEHIRLSIKEFERLIIENYAPNKEQIKFINDRLSYLDKAVDRLNRFDWKGLAISIVVSIAINLTVDTEGGRMLFKLFQQAFEIVLRFLSGS